MTAVVGGDKGHGGPSQEDSPPQEPEGGGEDQDKGAVRELERACREEGGG